MRDDVLRDDVLRVRSCARSRLRWRSWMRAGFLALRVSLSGLLPGLLMGSSMVGLSMGPLALLMAPARAEAAQCRLVEMKIDGNTARSGGVSIDLLGESWPGSESPTAYEGPPRIRVGNGPACTASQDVSIIFGKLWLGAGKVYISTYSGSEDLVFALDAKSCRIVWKSPQFEGPPAVYRNDARGGVLTMGVFKPAVYRFRLGKGCLPVRSGRP